MDNEDCPQSSLNDAWSQGGDSGEASNLVQEGQIRPYRFQYTVTDNDEELYLPLLRVVKGYGVHVYVKLVKPAKKWVE